MRNESLAREYLAALGGGVTGEGLRGFFTPDFEQVELPNALNPKGQRSDLANALERSERGTQVLKRQRYDVTRVVEQGNTVALQVEWTGVLAIPVAGLPAGGEMKAHFAVFLEFRDGRIARQTNYDCFEPFAKP